MKFTFLGTASCEGIPALFCNCPRCAAARALGGKNIRTRAQAMIDDDILIDLPPDTLYHFHQNGIEGHKIKHLLVTHSHSDHLTPKELHNRGPRRCDNMDAQVLHVWCSKGSYDAITAAAPCEDYVKIHLVKPFEPFTVGNYQVTALPANHHNGDEAVIYLIEGEKTLLYALDSGYFFDEVFDYLTAKNIKLDFTVLDCSLVEREWPHIIGHMGVHRIRLLTEKLRALGVATEQTVHSISHFSHNGKALHSDIEALVKEDGYLVSYDGCAVDL
jgi:phosphoribosyl 1,2-cyclic phosphate phosphodiesterase